MTYEEPSIRANSQPGDRANLQASGGERPLPNWLHVAIVAVLGLYFIIGGIAWTVFIFNGRTVPDSFTTLLATIAGGLVGALATRGGATTVRPQPDAQRLVNGEGPLEPDFRP
jgi:hypothetical protein